MINANELTASEAAALLRFYAESGVESLAEDLSIDLTTQQKAGKATPAASPERSVARQTERGGTPKASPAAATPAAPPIMASHGQSTIPDEKAITDARFAAESARSLAELKTALSSFSSCNLKHNARSTISLEAMPDTGLMGICGFPSGDDDRAGEALSGRSGALFERMLGAIGLGRADIGVTTAIPWRTPGDRSPTRSEADICRPLIERQVGLAEPKLLLLMGNFASRLLIDNEKTVFDLRGQWHETTIGGHKVSTLVTFSPSELLAAPANKRLAWLDLQAFRRAL